MSILTVQNITKNYGAIHALQNVSFEVPEQSVFGILGPNGSGKTTLLGIVMDVLKATNGNYLWHGQVGSAAQRRKIGTLLETPNFYHYLSAEKNLKIAAAIKGLTAPNIDEVLKIVNLYERKHSAFSTYSLGMKQRLAIAAALLGNPDTLVFDEPTNGLDPAGIAEIRELMISLNKQGKTIIMASHILDEVEKVCTHVAILQKGVLKASGTVAEIIDTNIHDDEVIIEISADNMENLATAVSSLAGIKNVIKNENGLQLICDQSISSQQINETCFNNGIVLSQLLVRKKNLEKRFLEITGNHSH